MLYASTRDDLTGIAGWNQPQLDALLRMQFDAQRVQYNRQYPQASFQIVLLDGTTVGRLYVNYTPEEVRLIDISLLPDVRGHGIGRSLLERVIAEADRLGAPVTLHVAVRNPARRLYERLGFCALTEDGVNIFMQRLPLE